MVQTSRQAASHRLRRCQAVAEAINILSNELFWPFEVGLVIFSIAIGLAILNTGALPKWLGWVTLVIGVVGGTTALRDWRS